MTFQPKQRDGLIASAFPLLNIGDSDIQHVSEIRYLGHDINNYFITDDDDIN